MWRANLREWMENRDGQLGVRVAKTRFAISDLIDLLDPAWVRQQIHRHTTWKENYSLPGNNLLFHRHPKTNPLVPDLAVAELWKQQGYQSNIEAPVADSIRRLASLSARIYMFQGFWNAEPRRKRHLVRSLQMISRVRGLLAELITATHYVQADTDDVIPLFLDPSPQETSDVLVIKDGNEVEIHCKSKIPGAGYYVPHDVFDFWAGCFLAAAERSGRSSYIKVTLSSSYSLKRPDELVKEMRSWLQSGLVFPSAELRPGLQVQVQDVVIPPGGVDWDEISKLTSPSQYRALSALPDEDGRYDKLSVFDVVLVPKPHPWRSLLGSIREARDKVQGNRPAIVSVHLFDYLPLEELKGSQALLTTLDRELSGEVGRRVSALVISCEPERDPFQGIAGEEERPAIWFVNPHATLPIVDQFTIFKGPA